MSLVVEAARGAIPQTDGTLRALVALCRPQQWAKNAVVPAVALVLGGGASIRLAPLAAATVAFCLVSSAVYVLNDLHDIDRDRLHPVKRARALPSGAVGPVAAGVVMVVLLAAGIAAAAWSGLLVLACVLAYVAVNIAYSSHLKHVPIADIVAVSSGFMLRALAGAFAIGALPHPFVLASVCCAAFAVILGKRRSELAAGTDDARQRPALRGYSLSVLDAAGLVAVSTGLVMYLLFLAPNARTDVEAAVVAILVLVVLAGVVRYLQVTLCESRAAESPGRVLVRDHALRGIGLGWVVLSVALVVLPDVRR